MDEKGRFFGKISVVDLLIAAGVLSLLGIWQFGGMIVRHRNLIIYRVLPNPVVAGDRKPVTVLGTGFSNGCTIRLGHLPEETARFVNEAVLETGAPDSLEPGSYSVRVRDPLGRFAELRDGIPIRWDPRIERLEPRRTYPGEQVEIHGRYFDTHAGVRLGDIPLRPLERESWNRLPMKIAADQPIHPGIYDVTVSNPNGGSQTLRRAIEILPRPKVTRVYPDVVTYGEKVILTIEGENLPKDAVFYFDEGGRRLGEVTWISPKRVRVLLEAVVGLSDWYGLVLQIPDGPKIPVKPRAVRVLMDVPMALLVHLDLKGAGPEILEALQQLPESRLANQGKAPTPSSSLRILLRGQCRMSADRQRLIFFIYHGKLMSVGEKITVHLFGRELTGTLLQRPIPVSTEDEWREALTDG